MKCASSITKTFDVSIGLYQGEELSPLIFSNYVNDLESYFFNDDCSTIDLELLNLLMYADDTVIFSETVDGLQHMLDSLGRYCLTGSYK